MRRYVLRLIDAFKKGDLVLLFLCFAATVFGLFMVGSTTSATASGPLRYLLIQGGAALAGIFCYVLISAFDTETLSEHRTGLVLINTFLLFLLIPFGETISGNRSWLNFPFLPFNIQAAEICKITYVLINASVMVAHQNKLSSLKSIFHMVLHLGLVAGINLIISGDAGVSLIFVGIFVGMAFAGGVSLFWFGIAAAGIALAFPVLWNVVMGDYQRLRIQVLFDPSLDPNGTGPLYQTVRALRSLTGGGLTGQGLFQGHRTQTSGALFAQHTDFIYCAIGEELGFVGCILVLLLLFLIVGRCIFVGIRSQDTLRRLVCFGVAASLSFQIIVNVGMCVGVMPVIGLTLPFISYGGSSIITLYAMLGLVSGVYAHPHATSHERYIRPPLTTN